MRRVVIVSIILALAILLTGGIAKAEEEKNKLSLAAEHFGINAFHNSV